MVPSELHFLTLSEAARLIAARSLSPLEYAQALIERIDALDGQVNAFVTKTWDRALEDARRAEQEIMRGRYRGPLHGIPVGLKDIFDTAGVRTTGHSRLCIDNVPARNATVAQRLFDGGAILMGKLATHEFASGGPSIDLPWPPARNPWNTVHFTGGSSSGPGAAVAAGFVPAALGTDTGGSIRIPAALCGISGIKPTYGLVSRHGIMPNSYAFDHAGPMAWTVEDCAVLLGAIAGYDPRDPTSVDEPVADYVGGLAGDIRGVRIGVVRHFWEEEGATHPAMAQAMEDAIGVFRELGAIVDDVRIRTREAYNDVMMVIGKSEIAVIHQQTLRDRIGDYGGDFVGRNLPGLLFSAADYIRAQRERREMIDEMEPIYRRFDVLLTAASTPAPPLARVVGTGFADKWKDPNIYTAFNVLGSPALTVCNGFTVDGLPLAMQIAGRPFDESAVLRVGHAYERSTAWRRRRPRLEPGSPLPEFPAAAAPGETAVDEATRAVVELAMRREGIVLGDRQRHLLDQVAGPALAAARRFRRDRSWDDEPADTLRLRGAGAPCPTRKGDESGD